MADTDTWEGGSPWLFLLGLVIFFGASILYLYDLAVGNDVLRGIVGNAAGAALLIAWAALDTLKDPDSEVATRGGAAGTALMLYGLYLLFAAVVIVSTGLLFHERVSLGLWYIPLALVSIVAGFIIFPTEAVIDEDDEEAVELTEEAEATDTTEDSESLEDIEEETPGETIADSDDEESTDDT